MDDVSRFLSHPAEVFRCTQHKSQVKGLQQVIQHQSGSMLDFYL